MWSVSQWLQCQKFGSQGSAINYRSIPRWWDSQREVTRLDKSWCDLLFWCLWSHGPPTMSSFTRDAPIDTQCPWTSRIHLISLRDCVIVTGNGPCISDIWFFSFKLLPVFLIFSGHWLLQLLPSLTLLSWFWSYCFYLVRTQKDWFSIKNSTHQFTLSLTLYLVNFFFNSQTLG